MTVELDEPEEVEARVNDSRSAEIVEPPGQVLLARAQAARRIGVSIATVRRMEGAELQPIVVDGKHCFAIDEIDRHRKLTDGDLAATAFQLFNDDKTPVDVVIALKEPPERVRELFRAWTEMSDVLVAAPPGLGHRKLGRYLGGRVTRRFLMRCVELVFATPNLRAIAEKELAAPTADSS